MTAVSNSNIKVISCSLAALFEGKEIQSTCGSTIKGSLHIPEYQRPYRWNDKQVIDLYKSIEEHFISSDKVGNNHDYYLGSIILHQSEKDVRPTLLNIIDGQQRLTSMGILCHIAESKIKCPLEFSAPQSIRRIKKNIESLTKLVISEPLNLYRINVTLVVTDNEDDAYKFFETQNTGGVRLSGVDIIKAHHLRTIPEDKQDAYAKRWEKLANLTSTVDCLMRGRYWKTLGWRDLETNWLSNEKRHGVIREFVVNELADTTEKNINGKDNDVGFSVIQALHPTAAAKTLVMEGATYAMRQPLWAGVNTIHYLEQFNDSYQKWCPTGVPSANAQSYYNLYHKLIVQAESGYLRQLYNTALLMYLSKFGEEKILELSLWLFRAVFSLRMSLDVVREKSVQKFAKEKQLLDWIDSSYNHEQLMNHLQVFTYTFEKFKREYSGVKARFMSRITAQDALNFSLPDEIVAEDFDTALQNAIKKIIT